MQTNVREQIARLREMTPAQLRSKYQEVFGEPVRTGNRDFLFKRIAWRVQSLAEGGLSERARQRGEELARDADIRMTMPKPPKATPGARQCTQHAPVRRDGMPIPGTILTRRYRGRLIEVTVLPKGFEWEGEVYRSLTAVAKAVTGAHWNGHLFFGLKGEPE